ncbi:MAG: HPr(Ser) kinase/phosphatase [Kiritimatiellae bacterium]|nr:HPr(Ser) kinase/phosphatase [Kiritimatiellia bacterium]
MAEVEKAAEVLESHFTMRDFVETGKERLKMELVVGGAGLDHVVLEPMTNRPGLALTGFYELFAWMRPQVIGMSERVYLESLAPDVRLARLQALFDHKAYCLVFACGMDVPPGVCEAAEKAGAVILKTPLLTREFVQHAAFVMEALRAPTTRIYGTTVEVAGIGVMLVGKAGLGKSETALGLIKHGNAIVADDLTCLRKDVTTNQLYASASPRTRNYMEIRGIGIINVAQVFGVTAICSEKRLDLVISLIHMDTAKGAELDRIGETVKTRRILGVDVPEIEIPVSVGRDLVNLVETAAQHHKLRSAGYDVVSELDSRLKGL